MQLYPSFTPIEIASHIILAHNTWVYWTLQMGSICMQRFKSEKLFPAFLRILEHRRCEEGHNNITAV